MEKKRFMLFSLFLCTFGNGFQIFHLSQQYFRYEINTNIRLVVNREIIPPTATFCIPIIYIIKWNSIPRDVILDLFGSLVGLSMDDVFVDSDERSNKTEQTPPMSSKVFSSMNVVQRVILMSSIENMYSIPSLMNNITLNEQEIFESEVYGYFKEYNGVDATTFDDFFDVTIYKKDSHKCFALDPKPDFIQNLDYLQLKRQPVSSSLFSVTHLSVHSFTYSPDVIFILGKWKSLAFGGFNDHIMIPGKNDTRRGITYDEYQEHLLPAPFDTKCRDYTEILSNGMTIESQQECYEKCVRFATLRESGKLLPGLVVFPNDTHKTVPFFDLKNSFQKETYISKVSGKELLITDLYRTTSSKCDSNCSDVDCHSVTYVPKTMVDFSDPGEIYPSVYLYVRQSPVTKSTCLPQYTLAQFMVDVLCTFSFWLGFTGLGAMKAFNKIIIIASNGSLSRKMMSKNKFSPVENVNNKNNNRKIIISPEEMHQQHKVRIMRRSSVI